jgi:diaminopimelate decarboxylase
VRQISLFLWECDTLLACVCKAIQESGTPHYVYKLLRINPGVKVNNHPRISTGKERASFGGPSPNVERLPLG